MLPAAALPRLVLASLVVVSPWLFGAVEAQFQVWLYGGVLAALAYALVARLAGRCSYRAAPSMTLVLICGLAIGALQLIPLVPRASDFQSPRVLRLGDASFASSTPSAAGSFARAVGTAATAERLPLSWYPASTRRDLALLVLASAAFLAGSIFFRTSRAGLWLCGAAAATGAAVAFFGLVQKLTFNGLLYWSVPLTAGGTPFGPFVNRNNAGGFLCLCLAATLGLTVWAIGRNEPSDSAAAGTSAGRRDGRLARLRAGAVEALAELDASTIVLVSLGACIVAGILCSLSRGASLAMIGAGALTAAATLFHRRRHLRLWVLGVTAVAGLALVSWVGSSASVRVRMATLLDPGVSSRGRMLHWRDGLDAAADFWQTGSGLGTYRYVYRPYQFRLSEVWYYHAENQYLETLVEAGVAGVGLTLIMIGMAAVACRALLRDQRDVGTYALGIAGLFALASQVIHAFFDFGLYVPANMLLFALLCGAICGRTAEMARRRLAPAFLVLPGPRVVPTLLIALFLSAGIWGCMEIRACAAVEAAMRQTRCDEQRPAPEALEEAIGRVQGAVARRDDDAEAHQRLAALWTHRYRAGVLESLGGETASPDERSRLWELTSPAVLHERAHRLARFGDAAGLERLRRDPMVRDCLAPSWEHLVLARRACALLPEVHLQMAELALLMDEAAEEEMHIERARRLAPGDPDVLFHCGLLELQAGRLERACASWQRSLALSDRYLDPVLGLAGRQVSLWHVAEKVLPASPRLLVTLARERYASEDDAVLQGMLLERAARLVEDVQLAAAERHYLRGTVLAMQGLNPPAIADLRRAVELRSAAVEWRYEMALLLKEEARMSEAHEQAVYCARMEPDNRRYDALLREINHWKLTSTVRP